MADPKGPLQVPIGFRADGSPHALELTNTDDLKVYINGGTLTLGTHNLLDGSIHPDTVAGSPVKGDVIVGIDQGAGQIKWQRLARGSSGQVLTVQADGSLAYASPGGGAVAQIVANAYNATASGTNTIPADDTIPQKTEGDEYMSVTITPLNAAHTLLVQAVFFGASSALTNITFAFFRDAGSDAIAAFEYVAPAANYTFTVSIMCIASAGSTAATTFKLRAGGNAANTLIFNGANGSRRFGAINKSMMVVTEYS